jgi:hypothetical protein
MTSNNDFQQISARTIRAGWAEERNRRGFDGMSARWELNWEGFELLMAVTGSAAATGRLIKRLTPSPNVAITTHTFIFYFKIACRPSN